jgi:SAM-dependent methyltransferase
MLDPKERFSSRVDHYVCYRPGYPRAVLEALREGCGLAASWVVADIGAGPGNLTRLFLENGNTVFAVEPNAPMRLAGERLLGTFPGFSSVAGSAERTLLSDTSVDLVVAGQAFHWFDPVSCKREFQRILRPPRWVALVWNQRRVAASPFLAGYEQLAQQYRTDRASASPSAPATDGVLEAFFAPSGYRKVVVPNAQQFDLAGLTGRLLSASHSPQPDHPTYTAMVAELRGLFDAHQLDGKVTMEYDTELYFGRI